MRLDAFKTNGSSPPSIDTLTHGTRTASPEPPRTRCECGEWIAPRPADPSRYSLNLVSFSVVREKGAEPALRPRLMNSRSVANLARQIIADDAKEHFWILMLDVRNGLVAAHHVSTGTLSSASAHPREVFGAALRVMGVACLVLVHNHPSGDVTPSSDDLELTDRLVKAGRLLNITVLDHVIIGNGTNVHLSLAQNGVL